MIVESKIIEYPDGTKKLMVYKNPYILGGSEKKKHNNFQRRVKTTEVKTIEVKTIEEIQQEKMHNEFQNNRRAKTNVRDYILCNDFDMFWNLTFANERGDDERCFERMANWLDYMRKKYGRFKYIFVPERHESGEIHFHGVTGGYKGVLKDSGVKHKGRTVYNAINWKHGFSDVEKIENKAKAANYITKYITKDMKNKVVEKGKKKYWCSRGLRKPVEIALDHNPMSGCMPDWENEYVAIYNHLDVNSISKINE